MRSMKNLPQNLVVVVVVGSYRVCGFCEQVLPAESSSYIQNAHPCERCRYRPRSRDAPTTKHLYKILVNRSAQLHETFKVDMLMVGLV